MGAVASVRGGYRADGPLVPGQPGVDGQRHFGQLPEVLRRDVRSILTNDDGTIPDCKEHQEQLGGVDILFYQPDPAVFLPQDIFRPPWSRCIGSQYHGDESAAVS